MNMQKDKNDFDMPLTNLETDTIGEIMNISMGAAATTVSVMLNRGVSITTPVVKVIDKDKFDYKQLEPAIGVEINYIEGLHGSNLMIMNITDVKAIVAVLLGEEAAPDESELDEIHLSALGEIMNQMMGSASTALASFFSKSVNISPPTVLEPSKFYREFLSNEENDKIVTISFRFVVEGLVDNQFITVLPIQFTKELVINAMNFNNVGSTDPSVSNDNYSSNITGHKQIPNTVFQDGYASTNNVNVTTKTKQPSHVSEMARAKQKENMNVNVKPIQFDSFDENENDSDDMEQVNLDLVMDVELNITAEIGHARKPVKEVLNLTQGSIIELDRKAGEPVDIIVNGQLIAKGDVVVIDDNFGVRITKVIASK